MFWYVNPRGDAYNLSRANQIYFEDASEHHNLFKVFAVSESTIQELARFERAEEAQKFIAELVKEDAGSLNDLVD